MYNRETSQATTPWKLREIDQIPLLGVCWGLPIELHTHIHQVYSFLNVSVLNRSIYFLQDLDFAYMSFSETPKCSDQESQRGGV